MAQAYPGTIPAALKRMGVLLDDYDTSGTNRLYVGSTTSKILVARAIDNLGAAQDEIYDDFLTDGAEKTNLCRKVTLVANSSDTQEFLLPPRVMQIYRVTDSDMDDVDDGSMHTPIASMSYLDIGWRVERNNTRIRFSHFAPDSNLTYYAWILRRPPALSYGTVAAAVTAATVKLAVTADYGETLLKDDSYNGAEIAIVTASSTNDGLGQYQEITDYVGSTRVCTVGSSWTVGTSDKYSIVLDLPEVAWTAIILRAAVNCLGVYKKLGKDGSARLEKRADRAYQSALALLRDPQPLAVLRPRSVARLIH